MRKVRAGVMPPQGAPTARRSDGAFAGLRGWRRVSTRRGGAARSGPAAAASTEPRRVRERDPRPAGARRRRGDAAAARRLGVRLRQRLGRAGRLAVAAGALSHRRLDDQRARGRRSAHAARQRHLSRCRRTCRRTSTSTGCRSAPSAALRVRHTFPLDGEYDFQTQALSHQPQHGPRPAVSAATSRSRSTASPCTASRLAAWPIWRRCSRSRPTPATPWSCACASRVKVPAGPHDVTCGVRRATCR